MNEVETKNKVSPEINQILQEFVQLFRKLPNSQQEIFKDFLFYMEVLLKNLSKEELIVLIEYVNRKIKNKSK